MTVQRHRSARAFLDRAQPWLVRAEVENGLVLGLARQLLNNKLAYEEPFYLATIERDDEVAVARPRVFLWMGAANLNEVGVRQIDADGCSLSRAVRTPLLTPSKTRHSVLPS